MIYLFEALFFHYDQMEGKTKIGLYDDRQFGLSHLANALEEIDQPDTSHQSSHTCCHSTDQFQIFSIFNRIPYVNLKRFCSF